jgi:hypothetical protein
VASHDVYYYPYSTLKIGQGRLLCVAALFFDHLYILDPLQARWEQIAPGVPTADLDSLAEAGILQRVDPAQVVEIYNADILQAIKDDLKDTEYRRRCNSRSKNGRWTVALAKLPGTPGANTLLTQFIKAAPAAATGSKPKIFNENHVEGVKYQYCYINLPLAVGESIILNHALFGGLLHQEATPITDEEFHAELLGLKIKRVLKDTRFAERIGDRQHRQQHASRQAAFAALADLELGLIPVGMPIDEILRFREQHSNSLGEARARLAWMARVIKEDPWSEEFADHVYRDLVPKLEAALRPARRTWRDWLKVGGAGGAVIGGIASLVLGGMPTSVAAAVTAMGTAGGAMKDGSDLADAYEKTPPEANGLHYLLKFRRATR